jgi:hypothetical protein
VLLLQMAGKIILCLPSNVLRKDLNAAEQRRFAQQQTELILREGRKQTVILKGLTNTAYNGRIGCVVGVLGQRTIVTLMPDGPTRSFPSANLSRTMQGVQIVFVNDTTTLRAYFVEGDKVEFFETDAVLHALMLPQDVSATMQLWPDGPHLPTAKVMAFYDLNLQYSAAATTRTSDAMAIFTRSGADVNMGVTNATDADLSDFWTSVLALQDSI